MGPGADQGMRVDVLCFPSVFHAEHQAVPHLKDDERFHRDVEHKEVFRVGRPAAEYGLQLNCAAVAAALCGSPGTSSTGGQAKGARRPPARGLVTALSSSWGPRERPALAICRGSGGDAVIRHPDGRWTA